ncbi:MAG TPA: hypothetical protein VL486_16525 [Verrucomicrobiae bacterium]|nr:hypothetical protein [Verrucomicrobiae bacterium]
MKTVIVLLLVVVIGLGFVQWVKAFKARSDMAGRVEQQLDMVDSNSIDSVKQTLVQEARKLGITLRPDNVHITYEDTEQRTLAQEIVGKKLGAQFVNKRATITVHYTARILGFPIAEDITNSHIRQVEAPRMPVPRQEQELLGPTDE